MKRNYRMAAVCAAVASVPVTTGMLEWHYHRTVSPALFAWAGLCVVGVGLSLRAK